MQDWTNGLAPLYVSSGCYWKIYYSSMREKTKKEKSMRHTEWNPVERQEENLKWGEGNVSGWQVVYQAGLEIDHHGLWQEYIQGRAESSEEETMMGYLRSLTLWRGVLEFIGKFVADMVKESQKLGTWKKQGKY